MVLEKKEEVTALDMRLQALDKDLDWKKEVTAFLAIKARFIQIKWNPYLTNLCTV